jgi:hypothetical protein
MRGSICLQPRISETHAFPTPDPHHTGDARHGSQCVGFLLSLVLDFTDTFVEAKSPGPLKHLQHGLHGQLFEQLT